MDGKFKEAQVQVPQKFSLPKALTYMVVILSMLLISGYNYGSLKEQEQTALFIFYGPILCVLTMLWFWGIVIHHFEQHYTRYEACFLQEHQKYLLESAGIFNLAGVFSTVFATSLCIFTILTARGTQGFYGYITISSTYLLLLALFLMPFKILDYEVRMFFAYTIKRTFLPFQQVYFTDFLLADILTSLARPLAEMARSTCLIFSGLPSVILRENQFLTCSPNSYTFVFFYSLPYLIRFVQCLIIYRMENNTPQIFNALKYSTMFPALITLNLRAIYYRQDDQSAFEELNWLWIFFQVVNALFSYYWDIERDWDIRIFSREAISNQGVVIKEDRLYKRFWFYYYLIISNLLLRFKFLAAPFFAVEPGYAVSLLSSLIEVFRRFQWVFVRIENELRKIQTKQYLTPSNQYPLSPIKSHNNLLNKHPSFSTIS